MAPSLSSSPAASCLLACLLVVYSASLSFAFALAAVRPRSCFVLAEDAWLARPPFLLSLSLSQAKQQTFGHRIGRCFASLPPLPYIYDTWKVLLCGPCYKLTHVRVLRVVFTSASLLSVRTLLTTSTETRTCVSLAAAAFLCETGHSPAGALLCHSLMPEGSEGRRERRL